MKKDDTCYYMSITKEENSAFVVNQNQTTPDQPKEGKCFLLDQAFAIRKFYFHFLSMREHSKGRIND